MEKEKTKTPKNPFWNSNLSIEERLDWLLANLTLEEKITCMGSTVPALPRFGIGISFVGGEAAHGVEARNDQNGRNMPEPTTSFPQPIGMSASWDTDLIKKAGEVTGTEARVLWHRHPVGGLSRWAPTVDLERDPRWGRNEEGYGEDPVLTGAMAGAYIEGMQGNDPNYLRVAATLKHFYANNTERGRGWKNASIDPRNMYELYLEPFRRCIEEHGAEAIMTAYNKINGIPGMLNPQVKTILKKQYGLKHAVCDGGAMELVRNLHHYFGTHAQSLAASVKAGVDAMSDPVPIVEEATRDALAYGILSEEEMDEAIRNMFRTKLKLGMFDDPVKNPYDRVTEADLCRSRAQKICLELTKKSIVLLKNENNRLPLSKSLDKNPVLVGPLSDVWYQDWYGGEPYHRSTLKDGLEQLLNTKLVCADGWDRIKLRAGNQYVAVREDGTLCLSDQGDLFVKEDWGDNRINFRCVRTGKYVTTISKERRHSEAEDGSLVAKKDAAFDWFVTAIFHIIPAEDGAVRLTSRFDQPIQIDKEKRLYSGLEGEGASFVIETVVDGCEKVARLVQGAENVILALGCHPMVNAKEEIDRTTLALPPHQENLAKMLSRMNPDAICVLFSNYPYTIHTVQNALPAIVWSATGSQDMGTAMVQTLYGQNAPAGRLNMTWYNSDEDLPDIDDYDIIRGKRTYRYFDKKVLYPFGYGLTYTRFVYSNLCVKIADFAHVEVSFDVQNKGDRASDEVVQIYAAAPKSRVPKPRRQLLCFERLHDIKPNEIRHVTKQISVSELRFYDCISDSFLVEEGTYSFLVGPSSAETPLEATIFIAGETTGMRNLNERILADHFDEYENVELTQGIMKFTAATAKEKEKPARFVWRDCQSVDVNEHCMNEVHFLAKSAQGGSITFFVDEKKAAAWSGDTRFYEPTPMFELDENAKKEQKEQQKTCKAIYSDIVVLVDKNCFADTAVKCPLADEKEIEKSNVQKQKTSHTIEIQLTGDVALCCFWLR